MASHNQQADGGTRWRNTWQPMGNSSTGAYVHMPAATQPLANLTHHVNLPASYDAHWHSRRTLVLTFDGTSDSFDDANTNVVKLFSLLSKDEPERQLLYYQPGIGTYVANPGLGSPTLIKLAKVADLATAVYLDAHICSGYRFLVDNYRIGDKICLFGYSRGAYTARCLAGMLHKVGLLTQGNHEQLPFAYKVYKDTSDIGTRRGHNFKKTFSRAVSIEFIGVWDTVSSVGVLYGRHLPFTSSNQIVKTFRHALALDERRAKFKANVWHRSITPKIAKSASSTGLLDPECGTSIRPDTPKRSQPPWEVEQLVLEKEKGGAGIVDEPTEMAPSDEKAPEKAGIKKDRSNIVNVPRLISRDSLQRLLTRGGTSSTKKQTTVDSIALMNSQGDHPDGFSPAHPCPSGCDRAEKTETDVLEVWFAGCHADVGGGSVPDSTPNNLGGPSLRWMIREIIDAGVGLIFDEAALMNMGIDPALGAPRGLLQFNQPNATPIIVSVKEDHDSKESVSTIAIDPEDHHKRSTLVRLSRVRTTHPNEKHAKVKQEYEDAVSPMYDQLKASPVWRLLEWMPIRWHFQDHEGKWHKRWKPNRSRPRVINNAQPVNFHVSVKMRMSAGIGYTPRAKYAGEPNWVE